MPFVFRLHQPPCDIAFLSLVDGEALFNAENDSTKDVKEATIRQMGWHPVALPQDWFLSDQAYETASRVIETLQCTLQYLQFCCKSQKKLLIRSRNELQRAEQERGAAFEELIELREDMALLKKRLREGGRSIPQATLAKRVYSGDGKEGERETLPASRGGLACSFCGNAYPSRYALESHLRKRHRRSEQYAAMATASAAVDAEQSRLAAEANYRSATSLPFLPSGVPGPKSLAGGGDRGSPTRGDQHLREELSELRLCVAKLMEQQAEFYRCLSPASIAATPAVEVPTSAARVPLPGFSPQIKRRNGSGVVAFSAPAAWQQEMESLSSGVSAPTSRGTTSPNIADRLLEHRSRKRNDHEKHLLHDQQYGKQAPLRGAQFLDPSLFIRGSSRHSSFTDAIVVSPTTPQSEIPKGVDGELSTSHLAKLLPSSKGMQSVTFHSTDPSDSDEALFRRTLISAPQSAAAGPTFTGGAQQHSPVVDPVSQAPVHYLEDTFSEHMSGLEARDPSLLRGTALSSVFGNRYSDAHDDDHSHTNSQKSSYRQPDLLQDSRRHLELQNEQVSPDLMKTQPGGAASTAFAKVLPSSMQAPSSAASSHHDESSFHTPHAGSVHRGGEIAPLAATVLIPMDQKPGAQLVGPQLSVSPLTRPLVNRTEVLPVPATWNSTPSTFSGKTPAGPPPAFVQEAKRIPEVHLVPEKSSSSSSQSTLSPREATYASLPSSKPSSAFSPQRVNLQTSVSMLPSVSLEMPEFDMTSIVKDSQVFGDGTDEIAVEGHLDLRHLRTVVVRNTSTDATPTPPKEAPDSIALAQTTAQRPAGLMMAVPSRSIAQDSRPSSGSSDYSYTYSRTSERSIGDTGGAEEEEEEDGERWQRWSQDRPSNAILSGETEKMEEAKPLRVTEKDSLPSTPTRGSTRTLTDAVGVTSENDNAGTTAVVNTERPKASSHFTAPRPVKKTKEVFKKLFGKKK